MPIHRFPFVSLSTALIILRVAVAIFFMAHAAVRIANGSIPQFGAFLATKGIPFAVAVVWMITAHEIIGGTLMALGRYVRWCAAGLMCIAVGGIVLIHSHRGWFVGEHGTGGMEYALSLFVGLLVIAAADRESR